MKKSFLIFGVMGALCATNGWAQDEASDTLSRAAKVTQRIEKVEANNSDEQATEIKELENMVKKKPSIAIANCTDKCCYAAWKGTEVVCLPDTTNKKCKDKEINCGNPYRLGPIVSTSEASNTQPK